MRTSIATVSLSGRLDEKLRAVAAAGFDAIEIFENDLLSFDGDVTAVRSMAEDLGLDVLMFQPFRDFEGMPEPQRSRALDRAERKFDLMQALGTDLLLVCSNVSPASQPGLDRAAEDLHELGERARARGIRIGFEALAWGRHIDDYRDAWEVVRRTGHANVGTIVDSFHVLSRGLELDTLSMIPPEKIFLVHLADAPDLDMGVLPWSRHFRCFPGQGRFPLVAFVRALHEARYGGPYSLEIFNDQFRAASARQVALDGRRSLLYLEERVQRAEGKEVAAVPPPSFEGLEFLEFAVDEEAAVDLEDLLARMGFRPWGRHRSKQVRVWRQGDVRLVVNAEPDGFAHAYNLVHGSSVCALAFRSPDAARTLDRARYYRCTPVRQETRPEEADIPAFEGVEGSLVYVVDGDQDIWSTDFRLGDAGEEDSVGVRRIDHLAQVTPFGRLASWMLFYRSVFGFDAEPQQEIADPSGLIQSQVVESADEAIRIVLNGSQSQTTVAGRFESEFLGGGVQHVAFETTDLLATVEALRRNGVPMLAIPDNYYDDLEARHALPEARVRRLRDLDVLFDRSEEGEFLHAYTMSFANRFFFEFVQRDHYDRFGAINAPIRLAAQQRALDASWP